MWSAPHAAELHTSRRAFTLVELLVVVGVIALLIGVLLPSLARARRVARRTACASKLHQVVVAATTHRVDHNDYYPLAGILTGAFPADLDDPDTRKYDYGSVVFPNLPDPRLLAAITQALGTEMGFKDIYAPSNAKGVALALDPKNLSRNFLCPSHADSVLDIVPSKSFQYAASYTPGSGGGTPIAYNVSYVMPQSYVYNEFVLGYDDRYGRLRGHAGRVRQPALTMFAADGNSSSAVTGRDLSVPTLYNLTARGPVTMADAFVSRAGYAGDATCFDKVRHQGMMNVAFCDGHVEARNMTGIDLKKMALRQSC